MWRTISTGLGELAILLSMGAGGSGKELPD